MTYSKRHDDEYIWLVVLEYIDRTLYEGYGAEAQARARCEEVDNDTEAIAAGDSAAVWYERIRVHRRERT